MSVVERWLKAVVERRRGAVSAAILALAGCTSLANSGIQQTLAQPQNDGVCPDLSGSYAPTGLGTYASGASFRGHLLGNQIGAELELRFGVNRYTAGTVKVFHTFPETLRLEGFVPDEMGVVASVDTTRSEGWYCSKGRLVQYSKKTFRTEGNWGESRYLVMRYAGRAGQLCVTRNESHVQAFGRSAVSNIFPLEICYERRP